MHLSIQSEHGSALLSRTRRICRTRRTRPAVLQEGGSTHLTISTYQRWSFGDLAEAVIKVGGEWYAMEEGTGTAGGSLTCPELEARCAGQRHCDFSHVDHRMTCAAVRSTPIASTCSMAVCPPARGGVTTLTHRLAHTL